MKEEDKQMKDEWEQNINKQNITNTLNCRSFINVIVAKWNLVWLFQLTTP